MHPPPTFVQNTELTSNALKRQARHSLVRSQNKETFTCNKTGKQVGHTETGRTCPGQPSKVAPPPPPPSYQSVGCNKHMGPHRSTGLRLLVNHDIDLGTPATLHRPHIRHQSCHSATGPWLGLRFITNTGSD